MTRRTLLAALLLAPTLAWAQTDKPQPELPKQPLTIIDHAGHRHDFQVEIATTPTQQEIGLMFRPTVPADGGMLFDWGTARPIAMWMKNTIAPLDMFFIKDDGTVGHIAENTVPYSLATIDSGGPVRATLEAAAGTARRLDIHVGDKVESPAFTPTR